MHKHGGVTIVLRTTTDSGRSRACASESLFSIVLMPTLIRKKESWAEGLTTTVPRVYSLGVTSRNYYNEWKERSPITKYLLYSMKE